MSWEQLLDTQKQNQDEFARREIEPPESCPNDGEPLLAGPEDGTLYCPFDGWQYCP